MYIISKELEGRSIFLSEDGRNRKDIYFSSFLVEKDFITQVHSLIETYNVPDTVIYNMIRKAIPYFKNGDPGINHQFHFNANAFSSEYNFSCPFPRKVSFKYTYLELDSFIEDFRKNFRLLVLISRRKLQKELKEAIRTICRTIKLYTILKEDHQEEGLLLAIPKQEYNATIKDEIQNTYSPEDGISILEVDSYLEEKREKKEKILVKKLLNPLRFGVKTEWL